jgi:hypothetical protein
MVKAELVLPTWKSSSTGHLRPATATRAGRVAGRPVGTYTEKKATSVGSVRLRRTSRWWRSLSLAIHAHQ